MRKQQQQRQAAQAHGVLAALLGWLLRAAATAVQAARANSGLALGVLIISLQTALLLSQRQQLAALHHLAAPPLDAWPGSVAHSTHAAAALSREAAHLQRTLQQLAAAGDSWRGQLERALAQAADVAARMQQLASAAGDGAL